MKLKKPLARSPGAFLALTSGYFQRSGLRIQPLQHLFLLCPANEKQRCYISALSGMIAALVDKVFYKISVNCLQCNALRK